MVYESPCPVKPLTARLVTEAAPPFGPRGPHLLAEVTFGFERHVPERRRSDPEAGRNSTHSRGKSYRLRRTRCRSSRSRRRTRRGIDRTVPVEVQEGYIVILEGSPRRRWVLRAAWSVRVPDNRRAPLEVRARHAHIEQHAEERLVEGRDLPDREAASRVRDVTRSAAPVEVHVR